MKNNIKGIGVALVTPFNDRDEVDYDALGSLIESVSDGGADYLVVLGTTAETPTLTQQERGDVVSYIKECNAKNRSLPLVVGIGGNCTRTVVETIKNSDLDGIDAILSVVPFYNKPSQNGMFEHYKAIAEASSRPIILYNVPGRTGVNMKAETTLRIAREVPNVLGVKEASGDISQVAEIISGRPSSDFKVISGDDNLTLKFAEMGGDGVISVAANFIPTKMSNVLKYHYAGDSSAANAEQDGMQDVISSLFVEGNPVGVKCALSLKGMMSNRVRLPLVPASTELEDRLKRFIERDQL